MRLLVLRLGIRERLEHQDTTAPGALFEGRRLHPRERREGRTRHRHILGAAINPNRSISDCFGRSKGRAAPRKRIAHNANAKRERSAHNLAQKSLRLKRWVRRKRSFFAAGGRTTDCIPKGGLRRDPSQASPFPICASYRQPSPPAAF